MERERVGDSWAPTEGPLDAGMYEFTASFHIMMLRNSEILLRGS